jgi:glycosyltransferase involved in cell wall biosynthesis
VPRYSTALARALDRVSGEFPDLRLTLLTSARGLASIRPQRLATVTPRLTAKLHRGPFRLLAEQALAASRRSDLLHFFDLSGPVFAPSRPFLTTVHDASVAHGGLTPVRRAYKQRLQPWALRRARAAVAVSAFARDEAVRFLGADPDRVHVVHSGPGLIASPTQPQRQRRSPYFLYVGNLATNKNLPFLLRAFDRSGVAEELLLVGDPADGFNEVLRAVRSSQAAARVHLMRGVPDNEVDSLYRGATALVHSSRYEGFGFTPLEAMARGCPVLASDIPALREVSGEGAMLLPPDDEGAWSDAMRRVAGNEALRDDLICRGRQAVARYSWDSTARAVCRLLLEVGEDVVQE